MGVFRSIVLGSVIFGCGASYAQTSVSCDPQGQDDRPPFPTKTEEGPYQQGASPSCVFTSFINSNLLAGATDTRDAKVPTEGSFLQGLRKCMESKGFAGSWTGSGPISDTGVSVDDKEFNALKECKIAQMAAQGRTVTFDPSITISAANPFMSTAANNPCAKVAAALSANPKGAVMMTMSKATTPRQNHMVSVRSVICGPPTTITIQDPNGPNTPVTLGITPPNIVQSANPQLTNFYVGAGVVMTSIVIEH